MIKLIALVSVLSGFFSVSAQIPTEREIAARFAPILYQALGDRPRSDYIAKFDFDGDWRGDNNWANAENPAFPLKAYVYYSVSETQTHYFVHYAVFHPRDYKGGTDRGRVFSELLRRGSDIFGDNDPTGLLKEATSAHENDLEGVLVVIRKSGRDLDQATVQFLQTLSHNVFRKYSAAETAGMAQFNSDDGRPLLYIEPRGHGIEAHTSMPAETRKVIYRYKGVAENPETQTSDEVGYDLVPIETTLWARTRVKRSLRDQTYGTVRSYPPITISILGARGNVIRRQVKLGTLGTAFLGKAGGVNMARPPWAWFDMNRRGDPLGSWFFDPAATVRADLEQSEAFSTVYVRRPFWAVP